MAEQSYPFENQSTSETQYSNLFRLLADTGVAGSATGSELRPYGDSTGMFVKIPTGTALVRGFLYSNDSLLTLSIPAAASSQRVDSVVLRLDPAANTINAVVKNGSPGGGAPALTQTDSGVYEVRIGDVTVPAGSTTVTAGQVTDRRSFTSLPWGEWTNDTRPTNPTRGKAGFNQTTGRPEYSTGNGWADFSQTTTDASQLTTGIIDRGRYGNNEVLRAVRDPNAYGPVDQSGIVNGDWNTVLGIGMYRVWAGNTNQNAPTGAYLYGTLVVFGAGQNVESRTQVYYEHQFGRRAYWRTAWSGNDWGNWFAAASLDEVNNATAIGNTARTEAAGANGNANNRTLNTGGAGRLTAGQATVTSLTSTGYGGTSAFSGYVDVSWPSMQLVSVTATAQSDDTGGCTAQVSNQSSTGCRIRVVRRNNASTGVNWVAVGN